MQIENAGHCLARYGKANEYGINRNTRRTTDKRSDENGDEPLFPIADGARAHDGRNGASPPGNERYNTAAIQPEPAHYPVENKGRPRHISQFFEQRNEEKKDGNLGYEYQNPSQTGQNPLRYEAVDPTLRHHRSQPAAQHAEALLNPVHGIRRPSENGLKNKGHEGKEYNRACNAMRQNPIHGCGEATIRHTRTVQSRCDDGRKPTVSLQGLFHLAFDTVEMDFLQSGSNLLSLLIRQKRKPLIMVSNEQ